MTVKPAVPTATYRVQLTSEFGFQHCALVLPYLAALGISTLYCSPVLQAASGSAHGYDTVDPTRLSANLGGEEGWSILLDTARKYSMTLLLDIVPNHMAATPANPWWRDVLEYGTAVTIRRLLRHRLGAEGAVAPEPRSPAAVAHAT